MYLRLSSISISRGERRLISNLTLALKPGELVVLTGPNGSGKSSLLRLIAGFLIPEDGQLEWSADGQSFGREGLEEQLIYLGHQDAVKPALTTRENLDMMASLFDAPRPVDLEALGLDGLQALRAGDLSAGQRRRLALARLRLTGRKLWLLDEPTVSLDAGSIARLEAWLQDHLRQGGLAILATHIALSQSFQSIRTLALGRSRRASEDVLGGSVT